MPEGTRLGVEPADSFAPPAAKCKITHTGYRQLLVAWGAVERGLCLKAWKKVVFHAKD